jgi:hypothetical protein
MSKCRAIYASALAVDSAAALSGCATKGVTSDRETL